MSKNISKIRVLNHTKDITQDEWKEIFNIFSKAAKAKTTIRDSKSQKKAKRSRNHNDYILKIFDYNENDYDELSDEEFADRDIFLELDPIREIDIYHDIKKNSYLLYECVGRLSLFNNDNFTVKLFNKEEEYFTLKANLADLDQVFYNKLMKALHLPTINITRIKIPLIQANTLIFPEKNLNQVTFNT